MLSVKYAPLKRKKMTPNKSIEGHVFRAASKYGLNPHVVLAVCEKESGFDTFAVRYERRWRWFLDPRTWARRVRTTTRTEIVLQSCSWGLMQVMGTVAREEGFSGDFPQLCRPQDGLEYGCRKLSELVKKYGVLSDALAAYNTGRRGTAAGKAYAADVLTRMDKYASAKVK